MSAVSELIAQKSQVCGRSLERIEDHQSAIRDPRSAIQIALLTGGSDRPYVIGLVEALTSTNVCLEVIGSNELDLPELTVNARVRFLNLRGDQSSNVSFISKITRIAKYYWRIIRYAATAEPKIFH